MIARNYSRHILSLLIILTILLSLLTGCSKVPEQPSETTLPPETTQPVPVLSPVELEIQRVSQAVLEVQSDSSFTFLAISDTCENEENADGNRLAGEAAAVVRNSVSVDFAALLGDIVSDSDDYEGRIVSQTEVTAGHLADAFSGIPTLIAMGEKDTLPTDDLSGGYSFQDFPEFKTRVIVLNTSDGISEDGIGMSAQQLQWFAESLDLSDKPDASEWGILILSHIPLDFGPLPDTAGRILDAYLGGTAVALVAEDSSATYDFTGKNAAEIIANFHGHSRCLLADNLYLVNQNSAMYRSPIVRICIPNAGSSGTNRFGTNNSADSNGIEFGETETFEKVPGTEKATAFNIVTIDRESKVIHCINYGAGYDREIPYASGLLTETASSGTPAPEGAYTNQVPAATEFGRYNKTIFNETGYRNHTYLVCNDIDEEAWPYGHDARYVTTGAIPFTVPSYRTPPVIYIWGATLDEDDHTRFFIYDSQKYRLVLQATGAEFKNYFTIEQLGEQYYRLTPIPEGKASVLFPATNGRAGRGSIAFSLKGTGENLVITIGEPILPE